MSVLVGLASFFIIQDFPDTARFLSEPERAVVISRLQRDGQWSAGGEDAKWKYIWDSVVDWKTWVGSEYKGIFQSKIMNTEQSSDPLCRSEWAPIRILPLLALNN